MAAVTLGTPKPQRHVIGDLVTKFFVVNGATGTTLNTGSVNILWVNNQAFCKAGTASLITGISVGANGVVTFTSSGTMVNEVIQVTSIAG